MVFKMDTLKHLLLIPEADLRSKGLKGEIVFLSSEGRKLSVSTRFYNHQKFFSIPESETVLAKTRRKSYRLEFFKIDREGRARDFLVEEVRT
jgi:hypothetical protein